MLGLSAKIPQPSLRSIALLLAACVFGVAWVAIADLTVAWQILIFLSLCCFAAMFWSGNAARFLLFMVVFTSSIDLSKALIVEGGIYSPGLSLYLPDIFLIAFFLAWLRWKMLERKEVFRLDGLQRIALVAMGWSWISAFWSQDLLAGVLMAITYFKYFLLYLLVSDYVRRPNQLGVVFAALALSLLLQFAYAAAQVASGSPLEIQGAKITMLGTQLVFEEAGGLHAYRPSGFLHHPNVLADYLMLMLSPALALFFLGRKYLGFKAHLATGLVLVVGLAVLILTLSRGGWIAFGVSAIVIVAWGWRRRMISARQLSFILAALMAGLMLVAVIFPAAYLRIVSSDQRSSESRWAMMDQAMLIVQRNPVLGVGLGGYNRAAQNNIPESFSSLSVWFQDELLKGVVHNKYLLVASEQGVIGLVLLVYLLWRYFQIIIVKRRWARPVHFALALGLSGAVAGQLVFFLFDHFYADIRLHMLWLFLGFYHALVKIDQRMLSENAAPLAVEGAR